MLPPVSCLEILFTVHSAYGQCENLILTLVCSSHVPSHAHKWCLGKARQQEPFLEWIGLQATEKVKATETGRNKWDSPTEIRAKQSAGKAWRTKMLIYVASKVFVDVQLPFVALVMAHADRRVTRRAWALPRAWDHLSLCDHQKYCFDLDQAMVVLADLPQYTAQVFMLVLWE